MANSISAACFVWHLCLNCSNVKLQNPYYYFVARDFFLKIGSKYWTTHWA